MAGPAVLTPEQRRREQSILLSTALDSVMNIVLLVIGLAGGSHTILAESIRGTLGWLLECFSLMVLRRIHRGVLVDMEYGSGKLEQVASLLVGSSMLMAATWIAVGAVELALGEKPTGTPLGLAAAAAAGMINVCCNLVAWDAVTGTPVWHTHIGDVTNPPMTYMLDGRQYILVATTDTLYAFALYQ